MRVLVYLDPTPRGEWALVLAAALPARGRLAFTLLATEEDAAQEPAFVRAAPERFPDAAEVRVAQRRGPAEAAMAGEAAAERYGLVVVPPAGRNAIQRMIKGSRVATVVRSVRAPVLVARRPPVRPSHVLAAVSSGESAVPVCAAAAGLAQAWTARASFLHVASEVALPRAAAGEGDDSALTVPRAAVDRARGALDVAQGLVVDEVLERLERDAADLLVIGATREAPWGQEDLSEKLLLKSPVSTLVVGPEGLEEWWR